MEKHKAVRVCCVVKKGLLAMKDRKACARELRRQRRPKSIEPARKSAKWEPKTVKWLANRLPKPPKLLKSKVKVSKLAKS